MRRVTTSIAIIAGLTLSAVAFGNEEQAVTVNPWSYGITGGAGYFNFRNSLYVDREPDSPGDLGEDWAEFHIKPWLQFNRKSDDITWFARGSWAYVRTSKNATSISGGAAESAELDDFYVGIQKGNIVTGRFEVSVGRYPYQLAHGYLISDGYSDGGSRGGYWSNVRRAWAPGGRVQYRYTTHTIEAFYLDRDERPESNAETSIAGVNYEWQSRNQKWQLGATYMDLNANELRGHLDGANVYNLRGYFKPFEMPMVIETEYAREDNGDALDSHAWYLMADYTWEDVMWRPVIQYRYAFFEGDNPDTEADENFDPLFPGFRDWGTWWQGEIAGEYFLSNSNLKTHMIRLHTQPSATIGTGIIFFDYKLDQPGAFQGGVTAANLGKEFNWYMDWAAFEHVSFSFVLARNNPGPAVQEAFDRTEPFEYAMIYLNFSVD